MTDREIIEKPWGREEVLEINDKYMLKKLTMWAGHRCSLQYHEVKCETIYVLSGVLKIIHGTQVDDLRETLYHPDDVITIAPRIIHRMEGVEDAVYLEASTPEMNDVIRIEDDYSRVV